MQGRNKMTVSRTEERRNVPKKGTSGDVPFESKLHLFFLGLLSIGFVGYFALRKSWIGFALGHAAALGIMGFYGSLTGAIAEKKGYSYNRAFQIGFFLPIVLGVISAFLFLPSGPRGLPLTCGGWVSLAAGIVVVISYSFVKKRGAGKQIESLEA
jgi:hypothetical protein